MNCKGSIYKQQFKRLHKDGKNIDVVSLISFVTQAFGCRYWETAVIKEIDTS